MTDPIFKAFSVVSKAVDIEQGIFEAMISTESVDREGDIVRATGAKLANFLKNPVVLWAHNYYEPPVARALSVEIIPGEGLKSRFQFPEWDTNPQADVIRRLWSGGFLNATSIGFIPIKSKPIDEDKNEDVWWGPRDYVEWELIEYSIVPVPANQDALRLALRSLATGQGQKGAPTFLQKRGRVLSATNERKLRDAADAITSVLSQLEDADQEDPADQADPEEPVEQESATPPAEKGQPAEPNQESDPGAREEENPVTPVTEPEQTSSTTDPTSNDEAQGAFDEEVLGSLSNLFDALSGV